MAIFNRRNTLSAAVDDWHERGLVDSTTAKSLQADILSQVKTRSFTSVVVMLGVICLAFGIMTFVAANWAAMSSKSKVMLLIGALWASWGITLALKVKGKDWFSDIFAMLSCAIFGACIMLISQIYHMQGDAADAVWLWAMGTGIGVIATRSIPALALYVILITVWAVMDFDIFRNNTPNFSYLLYWLLGAIGAWFLASRFSAHVLSIGLGIWLFWFVVESMGRGSISNLLPFYLVLNLCFVGLASALFAKSFGWLKGFEVNAILYLLFLLGALIFVWYLATDIRWNGSWRIVSAMYWPGILGALICGAIGIYAKQSGNPNWYDICVTAVFAAIACALAGSATRVPFIMEAYMLALSIWTIRMGWRLETRQITSLGFLGFAGLMLLIYFETLGSLMDTSVFYLGAGVLLLLGAVVIPKLLGKRGEEGAAK